MGYDQRCRAEAARSAAVERDRIGAIGRRTLLSAGWKSLTINPHLPDGSLGYTFTERRALCNRGAKNPARTYSSENWLPCRSSKDCRRRSQSSLRCLPWRATAEANPVSPPSVVDHADPPGRRSAAFSAVSSSPCSSCDPSALTDDAHSGYRASFRR
jgi:hypothetical protein